MCLYSPIGWRALVLFVSDTSSSIHVYTYQSLVDLKPLTSQELLEMGVWWWRELISSESTGRNSLFKHNFKEIWERSAFIYELLARIDGEYEYQLHWSALKLRQHSLVHRKWDSHPIANMFDAWRAEMEEPKIKGVHDLNEIYSPKEGWTLPMSFNLKYSAEELVESFRQRLEQIKKQTELQASPTTGIELWKIIELFDKKLLGDALLNEHEQALLDKVVMTYEKMSQQLSA